MEIPTLCTVIEGFHVPPREERATLRGEEIKIVKLLNNKTSASVNPWFFVYVFTACTLYDLVE